MYDPTVVDMFERVCRDIAPLAVKPQLQKAIQQISKAVAAPAPPPFSMVAPTAPLASRRAGLAPRPRQPRAHRQRPSDRHRCGVDDLVARAPRRAERQLRVLPERTGDGCGGREVRGRRSIFGICRDCEITIGERLTGWVAANQQPIINSEARLDLGPEAAFVDLKYCVSLPLTSDGTMAGVLSLYASAPFRDEQVQTLLSVLPHLALIFLSLETRDTDAAVPTSPRETLRIVASR